MLEKNAAIFIVPVVNVDGFNLIYRRYLKTKRFLKVRKNLHDYKGKCKHKNKHNIGVDLNRNYPFGFDTASASSDPCNSKYRGPKPFSEPETQAVRDFLLKWTNVKVAINLHAKGNYMLTPFHSQNKENLELSKPQY